MKRSVLELACVVGLALIFGTIYNATAGKLEFFVKPERYPNALVCKKADQVADSTLAGGNTAPTDAAPSEPLSGGTSPTGSAEGAAERAEDRGDGIPHIGFEEAVAAWRDGLLFVDARTSKRYEAGHISGAVSIGAWEPGIEGKVERLAEDEPTAAPVIVYCTRSKDCEDSHIVGAHLTEFGFLDVKVYGGGFPEWLEKNMPVQEGEEPGPRGIVDEVGGGGESNP